jgi:hypothetical protein
MEFKKYFTGSNFLWISVFILYSGIAFPCISSGKSISHTQKKLIVYKSSNIKGCNDKPVIINYSFLKCMSRLNEYAKQNNLTLFVTSSFRRTNQKINNAIVPTVKWSNHLVGHAIDMNIESNGNWYDSKLMRKENIKNLPHHIQNFFNDIRKDKELRWGGDFPTQIQDPVHIDDYLDQNPIRWLVEHNNVQKIRTTYKATFSEYKPIVSN